MKCPKCGYSSFEYLDQCGKCGKGLVGFKETYGIRSQRPEGINMLKYIDIEGETVYEDDSNSAVEVAEAKESAFSFTDEEESVTEADKLPTEGENKLEDIAIPIDTLEAGSSILNGKTEEFDLLDESTVELTPESETEAQGISSEEPAEGGMAVEDIDFSLEKPEGSDGSEAVVKNDEINIPEEIEVSSDEIDKGASEEAEVEFEEKIGLAEQDVFRDKAEQESGKIGSVEETEILLEEVEVSFDEDAGISGLDLSVDELEETGQESADKMYNVDISADDMDAAKSDEDIFSFDDLELSFSDKEEEKLSSNINITEESHDAAKDSFKENDVDFNDLDSENNEK